MNKKFALPLIVLIISLLLSGFYYVTNFKSEPKILILGNSISEHKPEPSIGWNHRWGMAATRKDNDYVHIVASHLKTENIKIVALMEWEENFSTYDLNNFKDYKDFKPDILIFQAGENIPVKSAQENDYKNHVQELVNYFGAKKIIIVSEFWPEPVKYQMMNSLAKDNGYSFADISKVMFQDGSTAIAQYGNTPVGIHPSDKGMHLIAETIEPFLEK